MGTSARLAAQIPEVSVDFPSLGLPVVAHGGDAARRVSRALGVVDIVFGLINSQNPSSPIPSQVRELIVRLCVIAGSRTVGIGVTHLRLARELFDDFVEVPEPPASDTLNKHDREKHDNRHKRRIKRRLDDLEAWQRETEWTLVIRTEGCEDLAGDSHPTTYDLPILSVLADVFNRAKDHPVWRRTHSRNRARAIEELARPLLAKLTATGVETLRRRDDARSVGQNTTSKRLNTAVTNLCRMADDDAEQHHSMALLIGATGGTQVLEIGEHRTASVPYNAAASVLQAAVDDAIGAARLWITGTGSRRTLTPVGEWAGSPPPPMKIIGNGTTLDGGENAIVPDAGRAARIRVSATLARLAVGRVLPVEEIDRTDDVAALAELAHVLIASKRDPAAARGVFLAGVLESLFEPDADLESEPPECADFCTDGEVNPPQLNDIEARGGDASVPPSRDEASAVSGAEGVQLSGNPVTSLLDLPDDTMPPEEPAPSAAESAACSTAVVPVDLDGVPDAMRAAARWTVWRYESDGKGDPRKVPYQAARPSRRASATDPLTWGTFDQAVAAFAGGRFDGIQFALGDGWAGVDVDDCRDIATGDLSAAAAHVVGWVDGYAEISPSGTGLKVFTRGALPAGRRRAGTLEMYDSGRLFTVTGRAIGAVPVGAFDDHTDVLAELHREAFPRVPEPAPKATRSSALALTDSEILDLARRARNGAKFERLWSGDLSEYVDGAHPDGNHSSADLALCGLLAFYTDDPGQIDRLFRQSGLVRPKWDTRRGGGTYGSKTIGRAVSRTTERYDPNRRAPIGRPSRRPRVQFSAEDQASIRRAREALRTGRPAADGERACHCDRPVEDCRCWE